jgi:hypothetical protein
MPRARAQSDPAHESELAGPGALELAEQAQARRMAPLEVTFLALAVARLAARAEAQRAVQLARELAELEQVELPPAAPERVVPGRAAGRQQVEALRVEVAEGSRKPKLFFLRDAKWRRNKLPTMS